MTAWIIVSILCGAIQGALLSEAEIYATKSWIFWAIILNNALSQFAIYQVVLNSWKNFIKKKEE